MEKIKRNNTICALSVYASRVSACVAFRDKDGYANIIGLGKSEGKFMGSRGVLNIDGLNKAIRDSVKAAQEEAGAESPQALISISGGAIESEKSKGMVKLSQRGEEISARSLRNVLKVADTSPIDIEKTIIHSIPQDFTVDGQSGIKDPVGLYGVKLEVETLLITAYVPFLQNVVKCLNLAGIESEDIVFSGVAASCCLLPYENTGEAGIVLMEIDNNFTAISIFFSGVLRNVYIHRESIIADGALNALKEKIDELRCKKPISKIILCGGAYVHEDFIEKVDSVFGIPSQMAYARNVRGSARDIHSPAHVASIGLAIYGIKKRRKDLSRERGGAAILRRAGRRVSDFLNDYF